MITGAEVDAAIAAVERKEAYKLSAEFTTRASGVDADPGWAILAEAFSVYFRRSDKKQPFGDYPAQMCAEQIEQLRAIVAGSTDPEIQSRVADILWLAARDHSAGRVAVAAYLATAMRLEDPEDWVEAADRYERAARLALTLGKKAGLITTVGELLIERVRHYKGTDPLFLTEHLLKLLDLLRVGEPAELAEYARIAAERARKAGQGNRARIYFKRVAQLCRRSGDVTAERVAKTAAAATWVEDAEQNERQENFLAAYINFESAIKAYRAIGRADLVADLQRRLQDAGARARQNMKRVSFQLDVTKQAEAARETVSGLSAADAICTVASFLPLVEASDIRKQVLEQADQFPLHHAVTKIQFDGNGRKIAGNASLLSSDIDERESAIREEMAAAGTQHYAFIALAYISPALGALLEADSVNEGDLSEFISKATIIPPDREEFFRRGLAAGFRGDFVVALHLLVPQIEHMLRNLLKSAHVITTALDGEGIEEEWPLGRLLSTPELTKILPDRAIFALRVILTDKTGANLRNLLLHGLLPPGACASPPCIFLWWLILHLVVLGAHPFREFLKRRAVETNKQGAVSR